MNRKAQGILVGLAIVLLTAIPAFGNVTYQIGNWNASAEYNIKAESYFWNNVSLNTDLQGHFLAVRAEKENGSLWVTVGLAQGSDWEWGGVPAAADVSLFNAAAGFDFQISKNLGLGMDANFDYLDGTDAVGSFSVLSGELLMGPVLNRDVRLLLGTWNFRAYAMAGPNLSIMEDSQQAQAITYCGLTTKWGGQIGYLLFDTLGLALGANYRYMMSPFGPNTGDSMVKFQTDLYFSGMFRF